MEEIVRELVTHGMAARGWWDRQRLARVGGWSHPLGRKSTGRRGRYLIPESGLYGGSRNHRRPGHVWQELRRLQGRAEAEWGARNTPASPLLTLSCFPLVPPMDFNRDKLAKEPRNAVSRDTEQSRAGDTINTMRKRSEGELAKRQPAHGAM